VSQPQEPGSRKCRPEDTRETSTNTGKVKTKIKSVPKDIDDVLKIAMEDAVW